MTVQHVTDYRSNENDQLVYAAKKIGRSIDKSKVFEAVYFGKRKIKTVDEISIKTGMPRKRVLEDAKKLCTAQLIHQTKHKGDTAYEKDAAYKGIWRKILKVAGNKNKINKIATKTNPNIPRGVTISLKIPQNQVKIDQI